LFVIVFSLLMFCTSPEIGWSHHLHCVRGITLYALYKFTTYLQPK